MKKTLFLTLSITAILIIMHSCNKDDKELNTNQTNEMSESTKNIYNKLVAFKHEIKNPNKSTTLMSIDSAQWYIEAYYNVTSGYPDSTYNSFEIDTANYAIYVDENNMISVSDIAVLISNMEAHLNASISQSGFDIGHMVVGDVHISNSSRTSDLDIVVNTGLGLGMGSFYTPFPDDECWFFGMTAGRCDLTPPTPPYEDAGDQLEWRFNNPNPMLVPYPNCESGSIKIIQTSLESYVRGYEHPLIYSEWYPGPEIYPGYYGPYWNVFLNYGITLFYDNEQSGGLVPDGNYFFTAVDITTFSVAHSEGTVAGFRYYHAYRTIYSEFECMPILD